MSAELPPRFTDKDAEVFAWLLSRRSQIPPTLDEMAEGLGMHRMTVYGRVSKMVKYGWINNARRKSRSLTVTSLGRERYNEYRSKTEVKA